MRIANIMFSAIAGGIEQAFVDYSEGLQKRGHEVTALTHPDAVVNPQLETLGIPVTTLNNHGAWDIFSMRRLRTILRQIKPDIAIAHTGRSFALSRAGARGLCPLVRVAHNYNAHPRQLLAADAVFTLTHDMVDFLKTLNIPHNRIFHIPNMVHCGELPQRAARRHPPVIGSMGRFVKKKGFDVYIDALKLLKDRNYAFTAILGGSGVEEAKLKRHAAACRVSERLSFPGWIMDKNAFYTDLDMFCLPSLHEPFGIVLLEAFVHGVPVVATDSEGPRDIITPGHDGLIAARSDAAELAAQIAALLDNTALANNLAANAFVTAKSLYSTENVSARIEKALQDIIHQWQDKSR